MHCEGNIENQHKPLKNIEIKQGHFNSLNVSFSSRIDLYIMVKVCNTILYLTAVVSVFFVLIFNGSLYI